MTDLNVCNWLYDTRSFNKDESMIHFGINELVSDPTFLPELNFERGAMNLNETMEAEEGKTTFTARFEGLKVNIITYYLS